MYSEKIPSARLWCWTSMAVSAPIVMAAAGSGWPVVLIAGIVCGGVNLLMATLPDFNPGKLFWGIQWAWCVFVLCAIAPLTGECWEVGSTERGFIPVTLLVLAGLAASHGADRSARIGSSLFWLLAGIYLVILAAGAGGIRYQYLADFRWNTKPMLLFALLLPSGAFLLHRQRKGKNGPALVGILLFSAAISLMTAGTLSAAVAGSVPNGFYEAVRSMNLFQIAKRFESFLSMSLTLGWFGTLSMVLSLAGKAAGAFFKEKESLGTWIPVIPAAAGCIFGWRIPGEFLDVGSVLLWIALPLVALGVEKIKKGKNRKKGIDK